MGDYNTLMTRRYKTAKRSNNPLSNPFEMIPQWGAARFDENTRLMLHFLKNNQSLIIDMHQLKLAIMGRYDPDASLPPDIDLTLYQAADLGVSRCHVQLIATDNMLHIIDLGSMNGTSINGKLLKPDHPALLRDGDELQLGLLKCMVFFQEVR